MKTLTWLADYVDYWKESPIEALAWFLGVVAILAYGGPDLVKWVVG